MAGDDGARLEFAPHLGAHVLSDDEVVLLSERDRFALNGRIYAACTPLLDGSRTADEIAAELAGGWSPAVVHLALLRLRQRGHVVSTEGPRPAPTDVIAAAARRLDEGVGRTGLTVCLVDDYLRPELAKAGVNSLQRGERLLPVRPVGRWLWFGPLLDGPDSEPTWKLFDQRLRLNRGADVPALQHGAAFPLFPDDRSPATVDRAISIASDLVTRIVEGDPPSELIDGVLTYDTVEGTFAHHPIARAAGSHRVCSPAATLARLQPFVSPITGIVSPLEALAGFGGIHLFTAVHIQAPVAANATRRILGRKGGASGKGFGEDQARVSCIAEAIERYSGGFFGDEPRRRAHFEEIADSAFHPEDLLQFSEAQYANRDAAGDDQAPDSVPARFDAAQAIEWVSLRSLLSGETRWVPAAYCYYGYGATGGGGYRGQPFCVADSNGCASGNTLEEATLRGLLELLERDACALAWYNRVPRPETDLDRFAGDPFTTVRDGLAGRGREVHVLDLRTDTLVPVALAVAWNRSDGQGVTFALGCHLDPQLAVSKALAELVQLEVEAPETGAASSICDQPHLMPSGQAPATAGDSPDLTGAAIGDQFDWCLQMLAGLGLDVLVLDQTRPDVGFPTVRVIVPGLRHFWRRLAPGRLYDVPVKLGWIDRAKREEDLNPRSVLI